MGTPMTPIEFGKTAKKLTHNPLGIIALFIVLIYAFASLVVGFGSNLEQAQKTPLIWFLVLFPVLVLLVFAWLVSQHHMKLYAPTDYRDEKLFIYPMSPEAQRSKLIEETKSAQLEQAEAEPPEQKTQVGSTAKDSPTLPKAQKPLASKFLLVEDLALRQLEAELQTPILRQVMVAGPDFRLSFDGMIQNPQQLVVIDVKYLATPNPPLSNIQAALYRFSEFRSMYSAKDYKTFKAILVFVTEFSGEELERFKKRILKRIKSEVVPTEFRFYSLKELKERFGVIEDET
jgi:hypothetical protein